MALLLGRWYRGTSLMRNCLRLGPYSSPMPRAQQNSWGGAGSYERGTPVDRGYLLEVDICKTCNDEDAGMPRPFEADIAPRLLCEYSRIIAI